MLTKPEIENIKIAMESKGMFSIEANPNGNPLFTCVDISTLDHYKQWLESEITPLNRLKERIGNETKHELYIWVEGKRSKAIKIRDLFLAKSRANDLVSFENWLREQYNHYFHSHASRIINGESDSDAFEWDNAYLAAVSGSLINFCRVMSLIKEPTTSPTKAVIITRQ
jgi:hypothetical protein